MLLKTSDFKALLLLAIPLILSGLIESSTGFLSNIFLAKLSPMAFAAGGLVVWFFATIMVIMWGILTSTSVLVSRAYGANEIAEIGGILRDSFLLAFILVLPASILIWNMGPLLNLLGQKPAIVAMGMPYLHSIVWCLLPNFISLIQMQFFIGIGETKINLIFTLLLVPLNIILSYVFIFGAFGLSGFGIAGLGWGATATYVLSTLFLTIFILLRKKYHKYFAYMFSFKSQNHLWELCKVGIPIGIMFFIEVCFFFVLSLIMGHISVNALAANQLTMQYIGFYVSLCFATAQAVTVRMGHKIGAEDLDSANRATYAGLIISFFFILIVVMLNWFAPHFLISLDFSSNKMHDPAITQLIISFLAIAALFQLFESLRISLFGSLRALKDTKFTLLSSFVAFGCLAVPLGYCFANYLNMGAKGYWWGLTVSSISNLLLLYWRYRVKIKSYELIQARTQSRQA